MSFFELVRREMHGSLPKLVFMSGLGGISNAAILAAINSGVQGVGNGQKASLWSLSLFLVALFLFVRTQHYVTITTTAEIEGIIHKLRLRMMDLVRQSELLEIERIGRAAIVAAITSDAAMLTQASNMLSITVQGAVLIVFVSIYVAYLSLAAFVMTLIIVSGAAVMFHFKNHRLIAQKTEAARWERRLFERLTDFLDGFKEVRLNRARSASLFADSIEVSRTAANIKIRTQAETFKMIVSSQISMYVLLGAVVFVAPNFSSSLTGPAMIEDHHGAVVRGRGLFRPGAIDTDPAECECRRGPDREIGGRSGGDGSSDPRRDHRAAPFRQGRAAQRHVPLRRSIFRNRLQDRTDRLQLEIRRPRFHHRRQRFGKIDVFAGAGRTVSAGVRRIPA